MHARVVGNGLPVQLELSAGQANDAPMAELLLNDLPQGAVVLADRASDADWIRDIIDDQDSLCGLLPCPVNKSPMIAWPFSVVCATAVGQDFNAVFELRSAVRTVIYSKLSRS